MKNAILSSILMLSLNIFASGGNIGSSGKTTAELKNWCVTAVGILMEARDTETMFFATNSNAKESIDGLIKGLNDALQALDQDGRFDSKFSLTKTAIERGLSMFRALDEDLALKDLPETEADEIKVSFLHDYYNFIIYRASPVDSEFHLELRNRISYDRGNKTWSCPQCSNESLREWESRYVEIARMQIEWLLNTFTNEIRLYGSNSTQYGTVGHQRVYFILGALIAGYSAKDLEDSIWSAAYGCSIEVLKNLSSRLTKFINNGGGYPTEPLAINFSHKRFSEVDSMLTKRCDETKDPRRGPGQPVNPGIPR